METQRESPQEIEPINEEKIVAELVTLQDSPLAGRVRVLLRQLETAPALSPKTLEIVDRFQNHQDAGVRAMVHVFRKKDEPKDLLPRITEEKIIRGVRSAEVNKYGNYAIILGIVGLFIFGFVLGIASIYYSCKALSDTTNIKGIIGIILGGIDIIGWITLLFLFSI